jgi:DhnA family fructose-bisphosphate aldolase class Ia
MREVTRQCQIPVVVAGGAQIAIEDLLNGVEAALDGGAAGTSISRNVITNPDPYAVQATILEMVHEGRSAAAALKGLLDTPPV